MGIPKGLQATKQVNPGGIRSLLGLYFILISPVSEANPLGRFIPQNLCMGPIVYKNVAS